MENFSFVFQAFIAKQEQEREREQKWKQKQKQRETTKGELLAI